MDTASKLLHLLEHWIEHNDAHAQTYREWAERAATSGLASAAEHLEEAIRAVDRANEALRKAEQALGPAGRHTT
ncbi:MAG: hypothetical protein HZB55_02190 [Deltaproteobacteria bacterium]|nr:hypothetical protein [Deltaproteobacteria bacterium]